MLVGFIIFLNTDIVSR